MREGRSPLFATMRLGSSRTRSPFVAAGLADPGPGPEPRAESCHNDGRPAHSPVPVIGGRLMQFAREWAKITSDQWVLDVISRGYALDFAQRPRPGFMVSPCGFSEKRQAFRDTIRHLLALGAIVPVPFRELRGGRYSIYFLVPKKEGTFRPILDLKGVNRCLRVPRFRMETLRSVIASVRQGEFLATLDLTEAYLHVGIRADHQRYLRFAVLGQHFQFQALPFGLATAPRTFTKIMVVVAAHLRKEGCLVHPYLDDWLIRAKSERLCRLAVQRVVDLLQNLGWVINRAKSRLEPSQSLEFLGALFDTRRGMVYLTQERRVKLQCQARQLLAKPMPVVWDYLQMVGSMTSTRELVPWAFAHMRPLQLALLSRWNPVSEQFRLPLPLLHSARSSMAWWLCTGNLTKGISLNVPSWTVVTTDASLYGWGAVCLRSSVQGTWSPTEATWSINRLETRAVRLALREFLSLVRGRAVRILSDNATTVAYINRQGGTRSLPVAAEARQLMAWAERHLQCIAASHIAGVENEICARWGTPVLDLMATYKNAKAPRFFARRRETGAEGVDALALPWPTGVLLYVFPPWPLIGRTLRRIELHPSPVILVAPEWPRRPWFADLQNLALEPPLRFPYVPDLLHQGPVCFDQVECFCLAAWLLRGVG
ncbi:uncharacterized protein LOC115080906 [Rhinatrema bivittatum]|uniref:uncharacterized protein LOC115080906 n=1 Tax=Rhinatrema bivittatum TaxID=194408 RepID=UPI001127BAE4|nr:uncharacterized protein LOC115080906 [Rhinatrema bivittatum]